MLMLVPGRCEYEYECVCEVALGRRGGEGGSYEGQEVTLVVVMVVVVVGGVTVRGEEQVEEEDDDDDDGSRTGYANGNVEVVAVMGTRASASISMWRPSNLLLLPLGGRAEVAGPLTHSGKVHDPATDSRQASAEIGGGRAAANSSTPIDNDDGEGDGEGKKTIPSRTPDPDLDLDMDPPDLLLDLEARLLLAALPAADPRRRKGDDAGTAGKAGIIRLPSSSSSSSPSSSPTIVILLSPMELLLRLRDLFFSVSTGVAGVSSGASSIASTASRCCRICDRRPDSCSHTCSGDCACRKDSRSKVEENGDGEGDDDAEAGE